VAGAPKTVLDLKITLRGQFAQPWRIVAVRADTPLRQLHFILQLAMDWRSVRDYGFVFGAKRIGSDKYPRTPLERFARVGDSFEYSCSDGLWRPHDVEVLSSYEVASRRHYPKCLDGDGVIPEAVSDSSRSYFSAQATTWHFEIIPNLEYEWKMRTTRSPGSAPTVRSSTPSVRSAAAARGDSEVTRVVFGLPAEMSRDIQKLVRETAMQASVRLRQPVSDEDLDRISGEKDGWRVERDGRDSLLLTPTTAAGSAKSAVLTYQVGAWAKRYGGIGFGSTGGFTLPDGSVFSPDAAWIAAERWSALSPAVRDSYAPIVPDIWIELRSKADNPAKLRRKLQRVHSFGASYVLLIDPYERSTWSRGEPPPTLTLDFEAIYDA
jgi:Uma2 family endonuclease